VTSWLKAGVTEPEEVAIASEQMVNTLTSATQQHSVICYTMIEETVGSGIFCVVCAICYVVHPRLYNEVHKGS
jgi:hypothetical protein